MQAQGLTACPAGRARINLEAARQAIEIAPPQPMPRRDEKKKERKKKGHLSFSLLLAGISDGGTKISQGYSHGVTTASRNKNCSGIQSLVIQGTCLAPDVYTSNPVTHLQKQSSCSRYPQISTTESASHLSEPLLQWNSREWTAFTDQYLQAASWNCPRFLSNAIVTLTQRAVPISEEDTKIMKAKIT